jgi:hypothetical protein
MLMKIMVQNVTHAKHVSLHGKKCTTNTFFIAYTSNNVESINKWTNIKSW